MKLEELFTYQVQISKPIKVGRSPKGIRTLFQITGGSVDGPALNGKVIPYLGGEFQQIGDDGRLQLDVRMGIETDDGVTIYVTYQGLFECFDDVIEIMRNNDGACQFGDAYFVNQLRFESGHEKYAWLNNIVCVAEGRMANSKTIEYRVYKCVPSS